MSWEWLSDFLKLLTDFIPRPMIVRSDERVVAFILGRWPKLLNPGWYLAWPAFVQCETVNIKLQITSRTQRFNNAAYKWNVSYRVSDPMKLVLETYDYDETVADLVEITFGDYHRSRPDNNLMSKVARKAILRKIKRELNEFGIDIVNFSVSNCCQSDIQVSVWELQRQSLYN